MLYAMKSDKKILTEQEFQKKVSEYINEGLTSKEVDLIRRLIRSEIAEIFFTLFRKRNTWV